MGTVLLGTGALRNDPCPCGSGKKYKRCCLSRHEDLTSSDRLLEKGSVLIDGISKKHTEIISSYPELEKERMEPTEIIERRTINAVSSLALLSADEQRLRFGIEVSENILLGLMKEYEVGIKILAAKHSKVYWLQLSRRVFPKSPEEMSSWTRYLCWSTFQLSLYKYGRNNADDISEHYTTDQEGNEIPEIISSGPTSINKDDIKSLYQIEMLAFSIYSTTCLLRRLWKGGSLVVDADLNLRIETSEDVEWAMQSLDSRVSKYGTQSQLCYYRFDGHQVGITTTHFMLFPIINDDLLQGVIYDKDGNTRIIEGDFRPNYLIVPVPISELHETVSCFDQIIQRERGVTITEYIALLGALTAMEYFRGKEGIYQQYSLMQRAYSNFDKGIFIMKLLPFFLASYKSLTGHDLNWDYDELASMISKLTYSEDDYDKINLWYRTGVMLFHEFKDFLYVDYLLIQAILEEFYAPIVTEDGEAGSLKGDTFETRVGQIVKKELETTLWCLSKKLRNEAGEKEIDLAFVFKDTMVLVECKARAKTKALERGAPWAVDRRWQELKGDLSQAYEKAEFLCRSPVGKNYSIEKPVRYVFPVVCSLNAEYIPSRDEKFWLTDEIPRICTPKELVELCTNNTEVIMNRRFSQEIGR